MRVVLVSKDHHFVFANALSVFKTFEAQFDVNWIENCICHFKNTHAAPKRYLGCCLPWNKLQLTLHQITLVGCLHCFQPTKKTFSNRLNHGLSQAPNKKHHVQLHTTRTTIYVSHRYYKNFLHRERQKKR